jgi:hypothetical protein
MRKEAAVALLILLGCGASAPAEPVARVPEQQSSPTLLQKQVAPKPAAELKEPPNQPEYPCEGQPTFDQNEAAAKKLSGHKKVDDEKKPAARLAPETIQRVIRGNYGKFRYCYEEGLRRNANLIGRVTMRFEIGTNGSVANPQPVCTSMPDRDVVRCITEAYKGLVFPQPEGGIVTVVYPIMFSPGD